MKFSFLPCALAVTALALHTSCKPKPAATAATATPEPAAAAPAEQSATPASTASAASAASQPASPPQGNGNRQGGGPGNFQQRADERMQRMKTALDLTDDQSTRIRAVFEQQFGPLRQQMGDQSISREERRANFEKARAAANAAVEQILTPEQKPKWEAYQKEMEQRRGQGGGNRRNGGGGNGN